MKDKSLKVKYFRTDTGCLEVFILKNNKVIADFSYYPDDRLWVDVPNESKIDVSVFPHDAITRNKPKVKIELQLDKVKK